MPSSVGPRRVVADAVGETRTGQPGLDPEPVIGAVGLEVGALESKQVGDGRALQHPVELVAEVVGVLEQLAAGLVGEVEEGLLAGHRRRIRGVALGAQAADVDGLDDAVGAPELLEHAVDGALQRGVAVALVGVDQVQAAERDVERLGRRLVAARVFAAEQQAAVEAFREIDHRLAPLEAGERLGHGAERPGEGDDLAALVRPQLPLLGGALRDEGVEQRRVGSVAHVLPGVAAAAAGAESAGGDRGVEAAGERGRRRDDEAQRVGVGLPDLLALVQPESVDGMRQLRAVRSEGQHQARTGRQRVGRHRHEVGGTQRVEDEVAGREAGPEHRRGVREGDVEEQQEVAADGGAHGVDVGDRTDAAGSLGREICRRLVGPQRLQVHHLEVSDGLPGPFVEDLEIGGGQAAHRVAVTVDDVDRHLHRHHLRGLLKARRRAGRGGGEQRQREHAHEQRPAASGRQVRLHGVLLPGERQSLAPSYASRAHLPSR